MKILEEISELNLKITWRLIQIGYLGYGDIQPQISKQDICEYGYFLIENMNSNFEIIAQLIGEKMNDYEFNQILDKLAKEENSNMELQCRKWIVYLTGKMISDLGKDYFEGILTISEFWVSLGQPDNTPHIFQAVGNDITPQQYYTEEMYNILVDRHREWIEKEIQEIIQIEKS